MEYTITDGRGRDIKHKQPKAAPQPQSLKVVYTGNPGHEDGACYRRLDQFFGVVTGATEVVIEGDAPHILKAYQDAGVKVSGSAAAESDPHKMNATELKDWLTANGIEFEATAKKPDLQALIPKE